MMGIGFPELMVILVIIMIIFGAGKLPEIGSAFGNSIKNFKKSMKDAEAGEIESESPDGESALSDSGSPSGDPGSISPVSASFIDFLKFLILLPNALPISGSFPAPKIIMMMTKITINSGKPMPIIRNVSSVNLEV